MYKNGVGPADPDSMSYKLQQIYRELWGYEKYCNPKKFWAGHFDSQVMPKDMGEYIEEV